MQEDADWWKIPASMEEISIVTVCKKKDQIMLWQLRMDQSSATNSGR